MIDWNAENRKCRALRDDYRARKAQLEDEGAKLESARTAVTHTKQAQEIMQHLAQAVQQQAHARIAEVVSICLSTVFDHPYQFHIAFDRKRGRTEARLCFVRDGEELDPMTASGGGVVDVAAFALRVSCLCLHRPPLRRLLVLDEPFRFVSEVYQDNIRTMLEKLAEDMGLQIVMVTHNRNLAAGTIVRL